ncbi:type II secretion system protein GspD [Parahaliea maris]|uniref:Type II secretion system protein GspD n=2 Tax=Parahaliea maris TaxID=2716870 RepID=A0A5C8ZVV4_9GAMM|nr:type II secretion system protein GspD [Parahaliea maris]
MLPLLTSCVATSHNPAGSENLAAVPEPVVSPETSQDTFATNEVAVEETASPPLQEIHSGSGRFIAPLPTGVHDAPDAEGDVILNFQNSPIAEVVKSVLGDTLKVNYTVDPGVTGTVSMRTTQPIHRESLVGVLDSLLRMNGAAILKTRDLYEVLPITDGVPPALSASTRISADQGYQVLIVPLQYISAKEMAKLLEPVKSEKAVVEADEYRNLLILAGTQGELFNLRESISIFDVDQLQGMSVGIFRLQNVDANVVLSELEQIFGDQAEGPLAGLVRFTVIERINALMVITPQDKYLKDVSTWVARLDQAQGSNGVNMYVYYVQNGKAEKLAELLREMFEEKRRNAAAARESNATATPVADEGGSARQNQRVSSIETGDISIMSYPETNALLISASPTDYQEVEKAIEKLDVLPMQVLIEASIVEVTLGDNLQYGMQWFFTNSVGSDYSGRGGLNIPASGNVSGENALAGALKDPVNFTYALFDATETKAVLNMIAGDSRLNVLSAPSLMVLDNHTAVIKVGDQVPIRTTETTNTSSSVANPNGVVGSNITSEIEYRDTGVTLEVTPRVNSGGMVMLDITQRVDDVTETTSSNIDSPTILQREITTSVAVQSRETLVLGGLIRDSKEEEDSGIPLLKDIPYLGALFGTTRVTESKTELVVLITPSAVANSSDARRVTDEYKAKLKGVDLSGLR